MSKTTVATHSGGFHADDVFAVAAFQLLLGKENIQVIRTRDDAIIAEADYVVDVGGAYDHTAKRYDHHQPGAPVRDSGIPYAGFGLVWKHYGEEICGSAEVAQSIEERLCQPIDAGDNGVTLYDLNEFEIRPFELYGVVSSFLPTRGSTEEEDQQFMVAVDFAHTLISRLVAQARANETLKTYVEEVYQAADDKQCLIFDQPVSKGMLIEHPEVQVIVYPQEGSISRWRATAIPMNHHTFDCRVNFPESWAGLRDQELQQVSNIAGLEFCHRGRFMCAANSKEAAIAAAKMAK